MRLQSYLPRIVSLAIVIGMAALTVLVGLLDRTAQAASPDFDLLVLKAGESELYVGESAKWTVYLYGKNGFDNTVNLSFEQASGASGAIRGSFDTSSVRVKDGKWSSALLTIEGASVGDAQFRVQGQGGGVVHKSDDGACDTNVVSVDGTDSEGFSLTASPATLSVTAGQSASTTITATTRNNLSGTIILDANTSLTSYCFTLSNGAGAPKSITDNWLESSGTTGEQISLGGGQTSKAITVSTTGQTPSGTYRITVWGRAPEEDGGDIGAITSFTLTVANPNESTTTPTPTTTTTTPTSTTTPAATTTTPTTTTSTPTTATTKEPETKAETVPSATAQFELSLDPTSARPGDPVTAKGSKFSPNTSVTAWWDPLPTTDPGGAPIWSGATELAGGTTDGSGSISLEISPPANAYAGPHTVLLTNGKRGEGEESARAILTVNEAQTTQTFFEATAAKVFGQDKPLDTLSGTELIALGDLERAAADPAKFAGTTPELDTPPAPDVLLTLQDTTVNIGDGQNVTTTSLTDATPSSTDAPLLTLDEYREALSQIQGITAVVVWRENGQIRVQFTNKETNQTVQTSLDKLTADFLGSFSPTQKELIFDKDFEAVYNEELVKAIQKEWGPNRTTIPSFQGSELGRPELQFTFLGFEPNPVEVKAPTESTPTEMARYAKAYNDHLLYWFRAPKRQYFLNLPLMYSEFEFLESEPLPTIVWATIADPTAQGCSEVTNQATTSFGSGSQPAIASLLQDQGVVRGLQDIQHTVEDLKKRINELSDEQFIELLESTLREEGYDEGYLQLIIRTWREQLFGVGSREDYLSAILEEELDVYRRLKPSSDTKPSCVKRVIDESKLESSLRKGRRRIDERLRAAGFPGGWRSLQYQGVDEGAAKDMETRYNERKQRVLRTAFDETNKKFLAAGIHTGCNKETNRCTALTTDNQNFSDWVTSVQSQLGAATELGRGLSTLPRTSIPVPGPEGGVPTSQLLATPAYAQEASEERLPALALVPTNYLKIKTTGSAVGLLVTDPASRNVGLNPINGQTVTNVEGATYEGVGGKESTLTIPGVVDGQYSVAFMGLEDGTLQATIEVAIGDQLVSKTISQTIKKGETITEPIWTDLTIKESPIPFTGVRNLPTWFWPTIIGLGALLLVIVGGAIVLWKKFRNRSRLPFSNPVY